MAGQHTSQHHEIGTATEGLGNISRNTAATIGNDMTAQTVRGVGTFNNGRKLRIAHSCLYSGGAYGTGSNSNFNQICSGEYQVFPLCIDYYIARCTCVSTIIMFHFLTALNQLHVIPISPIIAKTRKSMMVLKHGFNLLPISLTCGCARCDVLITYLWGRAENM